MTPRQLLLTANHVRCVHRLIEDTGPAPGVEQHTDADYAEWVARIIATHPEPKAPTQLFAYGSLIWKPEVPHRSEQPALARGWHRSFCLKMHRFRGTPEAPGLMMVLDRGGQCRGVIYELMPEDLPQQLDRLFSREFTVKPINSMPRWMRVETSGGPKPALGFVMNRASPYYAGRLDLEVVAQILARSCGHVGTGAEYLMNTVTHLEQRGIHDSRLWRLQELVARRIESSADG